jgi:hypothetical protein
MPCPDLNFSISVRAQAALRANLRLCDINFAVNLNRTQVVGALLLAALALVALLLRWKFSAGH